VIVILDPFQDNVSQDKMVRSPTADKTVRSPTADKTIPSYKISQNTTKNLPHGSKAFPYHSLCPEKETLL